MIVRVANKDAVEINDDTVRGVLSFYPEEELAGRRFFEEGFDKGHISYKGLLGECDSIQIPWQMFFLNYDNLKIQIDRIIKSREYKFSAKFFTKREGVGGITSRRIIDRLIRLQNFVVNNYEFQKNIFCGSLSGKVQSACVKTFFDTLEINEEKIRSDRKETVLQYLIDRAGAKYINVSRGVWKGGILPEVKGVNKVYKNTSGFVIKDDYVPFLFLPDEINPDEVTGRRIYTLVYLLVCIGLDEYDYFIESEFRISALKNSGPQSKVHNIVGGILLPEEETEKLRGAKVTVMDRDRLAHNYKITPTAVVVILKRRGIIKTQKEYEALLPEPYQPKKGISTPMNPAKVKTSVKKFCGSVAFDVINKSIESKALKSIEAQYLIFGGVKKGKYKEYCSQIGV